MGRSTLFRHRPRRGLAFCVFESEDDGEAVKRGQKHLLIPSAETRVIFYPGVLSLSIPTGFLLSSPRPLPSLQSTLISPSTFPCSHFFFSSLLPPSCLFHLPNSLFNLNNFKKSCHPRGYQISVARCFVFSSFVLRRTRLGDTRRRPRFYPGRLCLRLFVCLLVVCFSEFPVFQAYSSRFSALPRPAELLFPYFNLK